MRKRYGGVLKRHSLLTVCSFAVYGIALAAILLFFLTEKKETPDPIHGSMEGRFLSDVTMNLKGQTLHYRENEITNYLIIGVDKENVTETSGHQHGGQADFLVVLSIDRIRRTVTPLMLDRDAMVEMQTYGVFGHPSGTKVMQLCLAQAYSGVNIPGSVNTVQTVEKLLQDIRIAHYVVLDMKAIPLVNDALGGVEVTLKDDFTMYDPAMMRGETLRLMGDQAEFFVRGRMTVADGTNASRMARQQQYLSGLLEQFRQAVGGNPAEVARVLDVLEGHMLSDATSEILLHDVNAYEDYEWQPLLTLSGEHTIDEYGFAEFWVDEDALRQLVADVWFIN
ncbi:MAG: LCP family protein [Clostridia bacterium]|nr:LCP family protein [Clostridia bacterium]